MGHEDCLTRPGSRFGGGGSVRDFTAFKAGSHSPEATKVRTAGGVKANAIFQVLDNPNEVLVLHGFDTPAAAKAFLAKTRA
jgi:hypothetical protein